MWAICTFFSGFTAIDLVAFEISEADVGTQARNTFDQETPCSPLSWAEWLERVSDIDIYACPLCGGTLRVIADITDPDAIQTILVQNRQRAPSDARRRQRPGNDLFAAI